MDSYIFKFLFNVTAFFSFISYLTACLKPRRPVPTIKIDDMKGVCGSCRAWKPNRTHHCSVCDTCILKMDHHCPWVGTCIGYHNYKAFILFQFYTLCNGYMCLAIYIARAHHKHKYGSIESLTQYGNVSWWILLFINGPITLGVTFLFYQTCCNTYENKSTLEAMR